MEEFGLFLSQKGTKRAYTPYRFGTANGISSETKFLATYAAEKLQSNARSEWHVHVSCSVITVRVCEREKVMTDIRRIKVY